jgi:hypothetical protein
MEWTMTNRWRRSTVTWIAIAVVVSANVAGCKKGARDPFPVSGEVSGWEKTDGTRTFEAKNLWQYIDGDAEQYIQAGVVTTSTSDYKYQNRVEAVVDVHTMKDAAGAQKIMDNGRGPDAHTVQVGDAGYAYAQSVVFRKGAVLVRIVAYESTPDTPQALMALASDVEKKL